MALLLCRQLAKKPYYNEKLDLRIWSEQELCYVIYHYPLLSLEGLVTDSLIRWISDADGLNMRAFAKRLLEEREKGERIENLLLLILQECGYYTPAEIAAFKEAMVTLGKRSPEESLCEQGKALFLLGRYKRAEAQFEEAVHVLDARLRQTAAPNEKKALQQKKASLYCDMAAVSMQLFEDQRALEQLAIAEHFAKDKRITRMKYLINGSGPIAEEDRRAAEKEREAVRKKALESPDCIALSELFSSDSLRALKACREQINAWKKAYRRML